MTVGAFSFAGRFRVKFISAGIVCAGGMTMKELQGAIETMKRRIADILEPCAPSIYIYGSVALDDFRLGWSDIDLLVLTGKRIEERQAQQLVGLRQIMLEEEPDNVYYRSFEGGMLTLDAFVSGEKDTVVYWGTSGERMADQYKFDAFCMSELMDSGIRIYGSDIRGRLSRPAFHELRADVQRHYEIIRRYVKKTDRSFYAFGWLLDISRCLYTLRTGKIIAKTAAGEWALREGLCPCANALAKAVEIRKEPIQSRCCEAVLDEAEALGPCIQSYADSLERMLLHIVE